MMLLLTFAQSAHAFCGTYVGPLGSTLENGATQTILARSGDQTVLTVAPDMAGDSASFGLLIPVPEAITAEDVGLASWDVFAALDAFSAPRLVSYTCDDFYGGDSGVDNSDTGGAGGGGSADGVVVEAEFSVGVYEIAVLSATGAEGLTAWLDTNGFAVPEGATDILQEYLDADQHFIAARVDLSSDPTAAAVLEPLQFRYTSESFSLPIRIGTTVSTGEQDLVVYVLASESDGRASIANYAEAEIESDCMLPEGTEDPKAFYEGQLDAAFAGSAIWFTEYAWSTGGCDPCSSDPPSDEILSGAGVDNPESGAFLTRLRLRYSPDEATQDLSLYLSGIGESDQIKYIEFVYDLESEFPVCGLGWVEDGGECDTTGGGGHDTGGDGGDGGDGGGGIEAPTGEHTTDVDWTGGCAVAPVGPGLFGLLGVLALRRR